MLQVMPSNDMTPQQRALHIYEMLLVRPRKVQEIARAIGLRASATYALLNTMSATVPIENSNGLWFLSPGYELKALYSIWRRIQESVQSHDRENGEGNEGGDEVDIRLRMRDLRLVLAVLGKSLPPLP